MLPTTSTKIEISFDFVAKTELLVSLSYNIENVFRFQQIAKLIISVINFPLYFILFPSSLRRECSRIMLVKCGFSRFAEDSFGHTIASSDCKSLHNIASKFV